MFTACHKITMKLKANKEIHDQIDMGGVFPHFVNILNNYPRHKIWK